MINNTFCRCQTILFGNDTVHYRCPVKRVDTAITTRILLPLKERTYLLLMVLRMALALLHSIISRILAGRCNESRHIETGLFPDFNISMTLTPHFQQKNRHEAG